MMTKEEARQENKDEKALKIYNVTMSGGLLVVAGDEEEAINKAKEKGSDSWHTEFDVEAAE